MSATTPVRHRQNCISDKSILLQQGCRTDTTTIPTSPAYQHYDHHTQRWEQGTVIRAGKEPRSFIVKNDRTEGVYRRTRSQPKPRPVVKDNSIKDLPPPVPETAASQNSSTSPPQDSQTYTTISGRTLKPPNRLHV